MKTEVRDVPCYFPYYSCLCTFLHYHPYFWLSLLIESTDSIIKDVIIHCTPQPPSVRVGHKLRLHYHCSFKIIAMILGVISECHDTRA